MKNQEQVIKYLQKNKINFQLMNDNNSDKRFIVISDEYIDYHKKIDLRFSANIEPR